MKVSHLFWATLPLTAVAGKTDKCRCFPGDACWPSKNEWSAFNSTVNGRLIATVPIGTPCHDPTYDATSCKALQDAWTLPQTHVESSSSITQQFFANRSCDPFTAESQPCLLGNYVSYAVKVANSAQVATAVKFANKHNLRIVVRNTGHDYFGRSTGAGALAIWTHGLNTADYVNYRDNIYQGPAFKLGSGVMVSQAIDAAKSRNLIVVGAETPSVGLAGGYTQGGGHSSVSAEYSLGADQTLEFEVVTAAGQIVKANSKQNSDLYWALSGGGAGNYGIVTSVTVRAHPSTTIGGATLTITIANTTKETFDKAVSRFFDLLPAMLDQRATVVFVLTAQALALKPFTVVNSTGEYVRDTILAPFTKELNELGIVPTTQYTTLDYHTHYDTYMGPLPWGHIGVSEYQYGGRLIPRSVVENENDELQEVLRNITGSGIVWVGSSGNFKPFKGVSNAVLPQWRDSIMTVQLLSPWDSTQWDKMAADRKRMTEEIIPLLTSVTPGAGAYMNEGDFNQPDWQETFYGTNYNKLLSIKKKWDPDFAFYSLKAVGSDAWTVSNNGRLCKA